MLYLPKYHQRSWWIVEALPTNDNGATPLFLQLSSQSPSKSRRDLEGDWEGEGRVSPACHHTPEFKIKSVLTYNLRFFVASAIDSKQITK
jgi:hypothetical protein